jgi:phosphoribosylanthranilate isomerase
MIVKICGITNPEDARIAVEAGANALGFNFYPKSPRYLSLEAARLIVQAVPGDYLKVGVFVNAKKEELQRAFESVPLDVVQLHGTVCQTALPTWRAIAVGQGTPAPNSNTEAYLLDTPSQNFGGSGQTFDWSLAAAFPYPKKIVAGGLDGSNVADAIRVSRPWGVDACSRLEWKPGLKDPQRVRDFISAAFAAASQEVLL